MAAFKDRPGCQGCPDAGVGVNRRDQISGSDRRCNKGEGVKVCVCVGGGGFKGAGMNN